MSEILKNKRFCNDFLLELKIFLMGFQIFWLFLISLNEKMKTTKGIELEKAKIGTKSIVW